MLVLGIMGSPTPGGRTGAATQALLTHIAEAGCDTSYLELAGLTDFSDVAAAIEAADAVVFGSPVYRGDMAGNVKMLLDSTPRGMYGETEHPLRGKPCVVLLVGNGFHHSLAVEKPRCMLAEQFAAQVLSPGLYVSSQEVPAGSDDDAELKEKLDRRLDPYAKAFVAYAKALKDIPEIKALGPRV